MEIVSVILIITGLCLFETISSIDNAIINAEVLSTMGERARRWFLLYGLIIAVFLIRGILPWAIVWFTTPSLGAFAFTLSVPLIILGNGLGAFVVRELPVGNIDRIKRYIYLKNGAMYSILALGAIMVLDSFGFGIPGYLSPLVTFGIVGYFLQKSMRVARTLDRENTG